MATPTLDALEGFEHRADSALTASGTPVYNILNRAAGTSYVTGRLAGVAVRLVEDGVTGTYVREDWPGTTTRVFAGWFKMTASPSVDRSNILLFAPGAGNQVVFSVRSAGNGSVIECQVAGGTRQVGPNVVDSAWHRLELSINSVGTTWTCDWRVDGVDQTQASNTGQSAGASFDRVHWGSASAAHTATVDWDDCIGSVTAADYTNANWGTNWAVGGSFPVSEGTDVLGTTNAIVRQGDTTGFACLDDWATGAADTTTYITYTSTTTGDAASNYVEVNMGDKRVGATIWAVVGNAAVVSASTTLSTIAARVVDSGNATLTDIVNGDISETTVRYNRAIITAPSGGWTSGFDGVKIRVGLSSDTNPLPRCTAVGLQYAYTLEQSADATTTATPATVRSTNKPQAATATLTAATIRQTAHTVAYAATLTAAVVESLVKAALVALSATFAPAVSRSAGKLVDIAATLSATVVRSVSHTVTGSMSAAVAIIRSVGKPIAATATLTANATRNTGHTIAAAMGTSLSVARQASKSAAVTLTTTLTAAGITVRAVLVEVAATLSTAISRTVGKRIVAALSASLSVVRDINKRIPYAATLTVQARRVTSRSVELAVALGVAASRATSRLVELGVTLTTDAVAHIGVMYEQAVDLAMDLAVSVARGFFQAIAVTMTLAASIVNKVRKAWGVAAGVVWPQSKDDEWPSSSDDEWPVF